MTATETGAPPAETKSLFHMPCIGTLWHGYISEYKHEFTDSIGIKLTRTRLSYHRSESQYIERSETNPAD